MRFVNVLMSQLVTLMKYLSVPLFSLQFNQRLKCQNKNLLNVFHRKFSTLPLFLCVKDTWHIKQDAVEWQQKAEMIHAILSTYNLGQVRGISDIIKPSKWLSFEQLHCYCVLHLQVSPLTQARVTTTTSPDLTAHTSLTGGLVYDEPPSIKPTNVNDNTLRQSTLTAILPSSKSPLLLLWNLIHAPPVPSLLPRMQQSILCWYCRSSIV